MTKYNVTGIFISEVFFEVEAKNKKEFAEKLKEDYWGYEVDWRFDELQNFTDLEVERKDGTIRKLMLPKALEEVR